MTSAFRAAMGMTERVPYDVALLDEDLDAMQRSVPGVVHHGFGAPIMADALRQLVDAGTDCRPLVAELPEVYRRLPVVAPHVARALGMAALDVDQLRAALDLARQVSDVPLTARLLVEVGRLANDAALVEEGRAALAAMGDLRQLERYRLS